MKPIFQTKFPTEENPKQGDCFRACIASILELRLEEVPDFCASQGDWETNFHQWLAEKGLSSVEVNLGPDQIIYPVTEGTLCIVSGTTSRHPTRLHSVIGRVTWNKTLKIYNEARPFLMFEFLHDPHPSGEFIIICKTVNYILRKNPIIEQVNIYG